MNEESIKQDIYETIADLNAMTDYHFSMTPAFYTDDEGNPINKPVMDKTGTEQLYALYTEFSGEKKLVIRETLKNLYNHLCIISHLIYVKANAAKTDDWLQNVTKTNEG